MTRRQASVSPLSGQLLQWAMPALLPIPPIQTATVRFRCWQVCIVSGPANSAGHADYPWRLAKTLVSPRGKVAAVRFSYKYPGGQFCQVDLVRPSPPITVLKNSNATRPLWPADGQSLIGAGTNMVRLWTLSGTLEMAVPSSPFIASQAMLGRRRRSPGCAWTRGDLCAATSDQLFDAQGQQWRMTVTTRYRMATLQGLTSYTLPRPREADFQIVWRPD